MPQAETRQHAHELLDRMAPGQLSAIISLMEVMLDPVARALANAPFDDEPVPEEEAYDIAASRAALAHHETIPHDELLAGFGLSGEDFERMAQTSLESHSTDQ